MESKTQMISKHYLPFVSYKWTFVVTCCDHARSNGHINLSTFQEQKKCCHNIAVRGGQTVATSAHNNSCKNVVTNVVTVWSGLNTTQNSFFFTAQNKKLAKKTLYLINKLGSGLLATKVPGEKPSVFHTHELSVTLDRQTPAKMAGKTIGGGKEKVALPSAKTLFGPDAANLKSVDAQVGTQSDIKGRVSRFGACSGLSTLSV